VFPRSGAAITDRGSDPNDCGVIENSASVLPVTLRGGEMFEPPASSKVDRLDNWPVGDVGDAEGLIANVLLLGGRRADGSWWYELAGFPGPNQDGCWSIYGGSFDEGESVRLSSGLRLPKAAGFEIRTHGHDDVQWFPGHQDDSICVDDEGRAVYFDAFIGR
jgi:hypothetical protein